MDGRSGESLFRTFVENMQDCFALYSAIRNSKGEITDFKYDYVNQSVCRSTNYSKDHLLGKTMSEVFPRHFENGYFGKFCGVVETGDPLTIEDTFCKNGLTLTVEVKAVKFGDGFIASCRDISKRKAAEQALRLSEERFSKAFNANPSPMSITLLGEGCYIDVNESLLSFMGYTREEIIGKSALELNIFVNEEDIHTINRQLTEIGRRNGCKYRT